MAKRKIVLSAAEFKAKCLSLMDQVKAKGIHVVVTKHGKPVAELTPVAEPEAAEVFGFMRGTASINGDIVAPLDETWEAAD